MIWRWSESQEIAEEHPGDTEAIAAVDAFLGDRRAGDPLDPTHIAPVLRLPVRQVNRLLGFFADHGVVDPRDMVVCAACEVFLTPVADVDDARQEGVECPCGGCGHDVAASAELSLVTVFALLSEPPPRKQ